MDRLAGSQTTGKKLPDLTSLHVDDVEAD